MDASITLKLRFRYQYKLLEKLTWRSIHSPFNFAKYTRALEHHATPHYPIVTTKLQCLLNFSWMKRLCITNQNPNVAIQAKWIDLCLIKENNMLSIMNYPMFVALSKGKLVSYVFLFQFRFLLLYLQSKPYIIYSPSNYINIY